MSYSGASIFADDFAWDIRSQFREHIGDGKTAEEATTALIDEHAEFLEEFPDERPVFWLALAAAQWRAGRLVNSVRQEALGIIAGGGDLNRFTPKLAKARTRVLSDLRKTLMSPQPTARKIRKRIRHYTTLEIGDLLSYKLNSGRLAVFRVIGHFGSGADRSAVFQALDWVGESLPPDDVLVAIPAKASIKAPFDFNFSFPEPGRRKRGHERLQRLSVRTNNGAKPVMPFSWNYWENLDGLLEHTFGLT